MKYLQLLTNKYALALTAILMLALLCIMSTSELTIVLVLIKLLGFILCYIYSKLFHRWSHQGKVDIIKELFNDTEEEK